MLYDSVRGSIMHYLLCAGGGVILSSVLSPQHCGQYQHVSMGGFMVWVGSGVGVGVLVSVE